MNTPTPDQKSRERFFRAHMKASNAILDAAQALTALSMLINNSDFNMVARGAEEDMYQGLGRIFKILGERFWDVDEGICAYSQSEIRSLLGLPPETKGECE